MFGLSNAERKELDELRRQKSSQTMEIGRAISAALTEAIGEGGESKVIIINHLDININYANGGGATVSVATSKGAGSANSHPSGPVLVPLSRR